MGRMTNETSAPAGGVGDAAAGGGALVTGVPEQVLLGVWRWAAPDGSDRCGTALLSPQGVVLIDPPPLSAAGRAALEAEAGPARHVALTSERLLPLASAARRAWGRDVTVWLPAADGRTPDAAIESVPLGTVGEVALAWRGTGSPVLDGCGLRRDDMVLTTGDSLRVAGQTLVYHEGEQPPVGEYLRLLETLKATGAVHLLPARHAPEDPRVVASTAWAAGLENPRYAQRAAPVRGPRFIVWQAQRVLAEALAAPVVLRGDVPDPFACSRCGAESRPLRQTCSGPPVPRLCGTCREADRDSHRTPALRVLVCEGGCCTRAGARAVAAALRAEVIRSGAPDVDVVPVRCIGRCALGPYVRVASGAGDEPPTAAAFREAAAAGARRYATEHGIQVDEDAERNFSRFAPRVGQEDAARLIAQAAAPQAATPQVAPPFTLSSSEGSARP